MHRHRCAVPIAPGLAALLLGARALLASNMGFIVNCPLPAAGVGSLSGTHTLNLPYQHDAQLNDGGDLMADLQISNVRNIQKFLEANDGLLVYTGRKGSFTPEEPAGPNFAIQPGECYFVKMLSKVDYVIGGSSDPHTVLSLDGSGIGHLSGTNFVSLPYHAIARTASELMHDIGFANVASIQRFLTETDGLQVYTGRKGSPPDFPLDACECYFIKMNTTVNYIPSHY